MVVYITIRQSWFRFLASFIPGAGIAALLCSLWAGPRLGSFYDFLLALRPSPPAAAELLIIDTSDGVSAENILEPSAAASVLVTMTELEASVLILQAPVLGLSAGGSAGEEEIRYRFDTEFNVLNRNIRNLFDAIRTGSVAPQDSARYVNELVELSERGKERLETALVRRDEEGMILLEKAAAVFGNVRRPGDLMVQVIRAGEGGRPGALADTGEYSRTEPDRDGVLRRIAPVRTEFAVSESGGGGEVLEHIIYGALKGRYRSSGVVRTGKGLFLLNEGFTDGSSRIIPLDKRGAVLFEVPGRGAAFRRIYFRDFLDYDEADRTLRRLLADAEVLGVYNGIEGENNPGFLYDYAFSLLEDLLAEPDDEKRLRWIEARDNYFRSLEEFLYGPSEMNLVGGYEELIASQAAEGAGGQNEELALLRDTLIRAFIELREKYNQVFELRNRLGTALNGAFCILGPGSAAGENAAGRDGAAVFESLPDASGMPRFTDAEASALLANSLLTGRSVSPGRDLYLFLGALACAVLTALCLRPLGALPSLCIGCLITAFSGICFSVSFILSGLWLNPLVPAAASCTAGAVSSLWALALKRRFDGLFRRCYGPVISRRSLIRVIKKGKPLPSEAVTVRCAVIAVRNPGLMVQEDRANPHSGAEASLAFREAVAESFRQAGGAVVGSEGDMVLACFGSPLERAALGGTKSSSPYDDHIHARKAPAARAVSFVSELLRRNGSGQWYYGLDTGECTFAWSPLSGYSIFGRPAVRARILSGLASRYHAQVLVTASVNEVLPDLPAKKLDVLKERDGTRGEAFYELFLKR